ncbi:MAG TPA: shikimate dehydrogenase [Bacteroidales bacterium]|nr:shikimate dehydrogenase [Bacteroidales bacterium]HRZ48118.1 shikimate dehydrogenase [Bacteroidales bacterium]
MKPLYGLVGKSLKHSFSQDWFTRFFSRNGIDAAYGLFELEQISLLPRLMADHPSLAGFNVTIPYKQVILRYCDTLSDTVLKTGATNCIRISNGKMHAFNTDVEGFLVMLGLVEGWREMPGALILGIGGAARAVKYVFDDAGLPAVMVTRGEDAPGILRYSQITPEVLRNYPLLVNCTPAGMWPDVEGCPPVPYEFLTGNEVMMDLVYNPSETRFLSLGKKKGCLTFGGITMLYAQAQASWKIWSGQV